MELEKIISLLLMKHDCVIIPGMGGFISQRIPASFNNSNKIIPPYKRIIFNNNLQNDDGVLVGEYSIKRKIAYKVAFQEVLRIVSYWKRKIESSSRIEIEGIGFLYQNKDGKIRFEQDASINLLTSSYGLPILRDALSEKTIDTFIDSDQIIFDDKNLGTQNQVEHVEIEKTVEKSSFHWVRYAAAIFLLPIIFYSFWIPMNTNFLESHILSFKDFNPFNKQQPFDYSSTSIKDRPTKVIELKDIQKIVESSNVENNFSYEINENNYKSININKNVNSTKESEESSQQNTVKSLSNAKIYLIGNCFSIYENAISFIQQMEEIGINAEIVDQAGGLYRVSVGKINSMDDLQNLKNDLSAKGINNYWILNK